VLSGDARPSEDILIYDETGSHGAISTADWLSANGARVEMVTPDRSAGRDIGGQNLPIYLRNLYRKKLRLTTDHRLLSVRREGNALVAVFWNEFARERIERHATQIVVDRGTLPADGPYRALLSGSRNLGETEVEALVALRPQPEDSNPSGHYRLFRVGDALASRDIHAAMLDAHRIARAL
jgi:hypothetical protein